MKLSKPAPAAGAQCLDLISSRGLAAPCCIARAPRGIRNGRFVSIPQKTIKHEKLSPKHLEPTLASTHRYCLEGVKQNQGSVRQQNSRGFGFCLGLCLLPTFGVKCLFAAALLWVLLLSWPKNQPTIHPQKELDSRSPHAQLKAAPGLRVPAFLPCCSCHLEQRLPSSPYLLPDLSCKHACSSLPTRLNFFLLLLLFMT